MQLPQSQTPLPRSLGSFWERQPMHRRSNWRDVSMKLIEKSDIYALGGILYHLLSLEAPLTGEEPDAVSSARPDWRRFGRCDEAPGSIPDRTETASEHSDNTSPHNSTELVRLWCLRQIARRATARRLRGRPDEVRRSGVPEPLAVAF